LAGFQVTTVGRFWVTAEDRAGKRQILHNARLSELPRLRGLKQTWRNLSCLNT